MAISSVRYYTPIGGTTAYDLDQVVAWWPSNTAAGYLDVTFVCQESDMRVVIMFEQPGFEAALQAFYQFVAGTAVIRYLGTESGDQLVTESLNYIIV